VKSISVSPPDRRGYEPLEIGWALEQLPTDRTANSQFAFKDRILEFSGFFIVYDKDRKWPRGNQRGFGSRSLLSDYMRGPAGADRDGVIWHTYRSGNRSQWVFLARPFAARILKKCRVSGNETRVDLESQHAFAPGGAFGSISRLKRSSSKGNFRNGLARRRQGQRVENQALDYQQFQHSLRRLNATLPVRISSCLLTKVRSQGGKKP